MHKNIEAIVASPPEKDGLVVQLFAKDEGQWAEIDQEGGVLRIEIYPRNDGKTWRFDLEEIERVIQIATARLREK